MMLTILGFVHHVIKSQFLKSYITTLPSSDLLHIFSYRSVQLVQLYAAISHDPQYQTPAKKCTVTKNKSLVTEALMFKMLDSLHHTAEGADGIPAWFLRLAAPVLAGPLAHLVNLSLNTATVQK